MFHLWHMLAIVGVFALGSFFGRWSMRSEYKGKVEELENRVLASEKERMEWVARHH